MSNEELKNLRATAKGKLTRVINKLKPLLESKSEAALDNEQQISDLGKDLENAVSNFNSSHEAYRQASEKAAAAKDLENVEIENEKYVEEVETNVYNIQTLAKKYKEALKLHKEAKKNIPDAKINFDRSREDYVNAKTLAENVSKQVETKSFSELVAWSDTDSFDVETIRDDLKRASRENLEHTRRYKTELTNSGMAPDDVEKQINFDQKSEIEQFNKVILNLDKVYNARLTRLNAARSMNAPGVAVHGPRDAPVKLEKTENLKFSGKSRDFAQFKSDFNDIVVPNRPDIDIGVRLRQAVPEEHRYLLNNIKLHEHVKMMKELEDYFGTTRQVVMNVTTELDKLKMANDDKQFVSFVDKIEKAKRDLEAINQACEMSNSHMIGEIESKLPIIVKKDWVDTVVKLDLDSKPSTEKFEHLMEHLSESKKKARYQLAETNMTANKSGTKLCLVTGKTFHVNSKSPDKDGDQEHVTADPTAGSGMLHVASGPVSGDGKKGKTNKPFPPNFAPCLACADGSTNLNIARHWTRDCAVWNSLTNSQKRAKVNCIIHPFKKDHKTADCPQKTSIKCKNCNKVGHHLLLCDVNNAKTVSTKSSARSNSHQVLLKTLIVKSGKSNVNISIMEDNCSTDNYITHSKAKQLKLKGTDIKLQIEGINSVKEIDSKVYQVPIRDKSKVKHLVECFGLDSIASDAILPDPDSYEDLCRKFDVSVDCVRRPVKIDMLLSAKSQYLMSRNIIKEIGDMTLYGGLLGKTFSGQDSSLSFLQHVASYPSRAVPVFSSVRSFKAIRNITDQEILTMFREDKIGAECNPKCGGCQCGKCPLGSKTMSIKEEKEYKKFCQNMFLDEIGTEDDPGPYWRTSFPWNVPREDLENNYAAVKSAMEATERRLKHDACWRKMYEQQLLDHVNNKFAREVTDTELKDWQAMGGKIYYISHQMVVNPNNLTTPIRTVFNSSQTYKGYSLNSSWDLGPDMTGNLNGILLRFREGKVAATGDIKKMYYNVRITKEEEYMQLFIWRFEGEEKIRTFAMTRLVMGNKPSANISQIALKETANLEGNDIKCPEAAKALKEDSYVDNTFVNADNHESIKETIADINDVAAKGGFFYKPWVISGQDVECHSITNSSSNVQQGDEKALGMYWDVKSDKLFVKIQVQGKKKKISITFDDIVSNPDLKLNLRQCLSVHSRAFDPNGLILPVKMIGNLLFRFTLQSLSEKRKNEACSMSKSTTNRLPWDLEITGELKEKWLEYFKMLFSIHEVTFDRSIKPDNVDPNVKPMLASFSDGNKDAYGAVFYIVWTLLDGSKACRLIMAKAKLAPLLQQGEVVKNELSGATFACRMKTWIIQNSNIEFGEHVHFLDSRIVQDMIKKDSYLLNTFAGLRVKEINAKTDADSWNHISSKDNHCADILTKGAGPDKIREGSQYQNGPPWLVEDRSSWPITEVNLDKSERDIIKGFEKASKSLSLTSKAVNAACSMSDNDQDILEKFIEDLSSLRKIINAVAFTQRLLGREKREKRTEAEKEEYRRHHKHDSKKKVDSNPITAEEYQDALKILIHHEQKKIDPKRFSGFNLLEEKIVLKSGKELCLLHVASRIKNFPVKFSDENNKVYALPPGLFAERIAQHYHAKYHKDIDTVVSHIRNEFWIPGLRKIVTKIDSMCKFCMIQRKKISEQIMGDLPLFRSQPSKPFSFCLMDLWGPLTIKDAVVKKGSRVRKKVWGCLFSCASTRAVYLDVAEDYSTQAILHCIRRLMSDHGSVHTIVSDPGTQLKGASKELINYRKGWSEAELIRFGAEHGIEWKFVMAASQHQNGACEVLIKLVKGIMKALLEAIGCSMLNLNELFTVLKETANLCNERPIGIKPNQKTDPEYLSPNSLLLGRCSDRISSGPFQSKDAFDDNPATDTKRFILVQKIVDQFWRNWTKLYFPTLLRRQKWHLQKRNVGVGDICVLQDQNAMRGEWRLCEVTEVFPDSNNVVRNVEVTAPSPSTLTGDPSYKKDAARIKMRRHVKNIIVIVPKENQKNEIDHAGECTKKI